jgi:hypothetical protein
MASTTSWPGPERRRASCSSSITAASRTSASAAIAICSGISSRASTFLLC